MNMQEVIGRILKRRIEREKESNTLNLDEITKTLNIFLAGGSIMPEQYAEFTVLITPTTTAS